ncbi:MAG: bifunctional oligoribonuclease/PAP phosphatase NrnA [Nitrososphaerales archaeon]
MLKQVSRSLHPLLSKQEIKLVYVVTHRLADVDAYCSAYGVAKLLKSLAKDSRVKVVFPGGLNTIAKIVRKKFPLYIENDPDFVRASLIVVVDTSSPSLLSEAMPEIEKSRAKKVLVDHHPLGNRAKRLADILFVDKEASSTCEIVYRLYKTNKVKIGKQVAQVLLIGIMADSQHLFLASNKTIEAVNNLCRLGASLEMAKKTLTRKRDASECIARIKAAQRTSIYNVNGFLVAFSRVGSFHASVAKALMDLGADLAIVVGGDEKESKASLRATQQFHELSKIHLGTDIAAELSDSGGGHPTAASLSAKVGENELIKMLMEAVQSRIGKLNMVK